MRGPATLTLALAALRHAGDGVDLDRAVLAEARERADLAQLREGRAATAAEVVRAVDVGAVRAGAAVDGLLGRGARRGGDEGVVAGAAGERGAGERGLELCRCRCRRRPCRAADRVVALAAGDGRVALRDVDRVVAVAAVDRDRCRRRRR